MTGYSAGFSGYVNKTTNGGNSWSTITTASFNWLFSIYFPTGNDTGWACGRFGTIEKTENGGANWSVLSSGTGEHLNDIVVDKFGFSSSAYGWCVGNNGTILQAGLVFVPQSSGTTNNLNSISAVDANLDFVAGSSGTILKTTDAGSNWVTKTSGTTEELKSICFINSSTGYVCGTGGVIRVTYDGGSTWSPQTSGTTETLNSIDFEETNYDNGYAVGDNGIALYTDNGGITWTKQATGSSTGINSVFVKELPTSSSSLSTVIRLVGRFSKYAKRVATSALPVELNSFTYSLSGKNDVELIWQTSSETNNQGFEIQRSISNQWSIIGFVNGYGNSNTTHDYSYTDKNLNSGKYNYRLKQIDFNGNYEYYNLSSEVVIGSPEKFELSQNYPNPFNPTTNLEFRIPASPQGGSELGFVSLKVYNSIGQEVKILVNENKNPGSYKVKFNGADFSSGIYFYTLYVDGKALQTRKMLLVK
jgi:photosystem II stability/assembly factor-like uncharacterized protein